MSNKVSEKIIQEIKVAFNKSNESYTVKIKCGGDYIEQYVLYYDNIRYNHLKEDLDLCIRQTELMRDFVATKKKDEKECWFNSAMSEFNGKNRIEVSKKLRLF